MSKSSGTNRDELVYQVKIAEQLEHFDDMVIHVSSLVKLGKLSEQERVLLSLAYKNLIGPKRTALRYLNTIDKEGLTCASRPDVMKMYRDQLELEIRNLAHGLIVNLDNYILNKETDDEEKVFYLKLKADYFRYLAEFEEGNDKNDAAECSLISYKEAFSLAAIKLPPTHPLRLGVALNLSVFYYEIANSADRACKTAKEAFDDAIAELDNISEENYKDSTLVMQLLRDNLNLWITDMQSDEKDPRE